MCKIILVIFSIYSITSLLKSETSVIIQSTTSTKNSGFYSYILPLIYKDLKIKAKVVALGTGAAIRNSMNCDGDLLIVHSPIQEKKFILHGYAKTSNYIMHNHFVIIGPKSDPLKIKNIKKPEYALKKIFDYKYLFVSRGDKSGTHDKEMSLWGIININPELHSGSWYLETGTGMGATINTAVGLGAYTFTDKASWISFRNKYDFDILIDGDKSLINKYSALAISKDKCPSAKENESQEIIDWLLSENGKRSILNFKINQRQLFFIE